MHRASDNSMIVGNFRGGSYLALINCRHVSYEFLISLLILQRSRPQAAAIWRLLFLSLPYIFISFRVCYKFQDEFYCTCVYWKQNKKETFTKII